MLYTCADYRSEMMLLGLRQRLNDDELSVAEREALEVQIRELEKALGLDEL